MIGTSDTTRIPVHAVRFHPLSYGDPNGQLFEWEGNLYRAIGSSSAALYGRLFNEGVIQRLVEQHFLVETDLVPLSLDGFEAVLQHRQIPCVSYAYEWPAPMLKDAALLVLDFNLELARTGLATQDAHPANVLFNGCEPVFVDFGSIVAIAPEAPWAAVDEFCRFYLYPLYLMAGGQGRIARWLLHDTEGGVRSSDFFRGLQPMVPIRHGVRHAVHYQIQRRMADWRPRLVARIPPSVRSVLKRTFKSAGTRRVTAGGQTPPSRVRILQRLREEIHAITFPVRRSAWSEYYDGSFPPFSPSETWTPKHHAVWEALRRLQPASVLDIGSNQGWYSQLATRSGSRVVAFDTDEISIASLYARAKTEGLPILPLVMDVRYPSPGSGLRNECFSPASQRLACDLVLALALIHHLVFKQRLTFEKVVGALEQFAARWLLVEFVAREDPYVAPLWSAERHAWYSLDGFIAALRTRFDHIERLPSSTPHRTLLLCHRERWTTSSNDS